MLSGKFLRSLIIAPVAALLLLMSSGTAHAIPVLQLYIEGSTFEDSDETWVTGDADFTLWVIGDVGHYGTIYDVVLSWVYNSDEVGTITITPTTANMYVTDPSTPSVPTATTPPDGSDDPPLMISGAALPEHDPYKVGTTWETWALGDMTLTDSEVADLTQGVCVYDPGDPACTYPSMGQVNAYDISITGYSWVHFDAFGQIVVDSQLVDRFAPFSHDAERKKVPEPGTLLLLGLGLIGLWGWTKRFGKASISRSN